MSIKVENLINLDRLTQYDGLIKNKIKEHSDIQASDTVSGHVKVDTGLSDTSTNPVQNKVVKNALDSKVPVTRTVNGKALSSNISLSASDVGADPSGSSNSALSSAKSYTDTQVSTVNNTLTSHTGNTSNPHSVTKAQVGLGNVENKSSATIRGELTKDNVTKALGYTPPTTNTTYGVATSSTLGLIKSGTDITVDSSGNVSVNDNSHNHTISNISSLQSTLDGKLAKTTYEYNKELALGSFGKVCIGKFPCYDSNITVEIKSTTNTTYNGTLIIATQNINTSLGGTYKCVVYGDENNTLTSSIKIEYVSGSNVFSVYINLPPWSKNLLHIQCVSLSGSPTDIATTVDSIPSTATIVPTNAFNHTHNYAGSSSAGGSATSATKLDTDTVGSTTQPTYFSGGKPTACTYTLGKSVPSDAKFTDTWRGIQNNLTSTSTTDSLSANQGRLLANGSARDDTKLPLSGGKMLGSIKFNSNSLPQKTLSYICGIDAFADGGEMGWQSKDEFLSNCSKAGHTHDDRYYTESEMDTKLNTKLNTSLKGTASGLAELDSTGRVPSSQLPSYVDDVIEGYLYNNKFYKESDHTTVITGETGKIYVDLTSNKTYRWSGSAFVVISETLALGETSATAYRGDRGKIAYDHSQVAHAPSNAEVNQNAFSNVTVGSTTIAADSKTDTLTLVAGSNVTLTPDATNDKITISSTDTDTKVTQSAISSADYTNWRSLIWGASNSGTEGFTPSTVTDGVYTCNTLSVQPSSGTIRASVFKGNLSGNASSATTLATARTINGTSFNGSANITTANWGTSRTLTIGGTGKSVNGSGNVSWNLNEIGALPQIIGYYGSDEANTSGWYKVCTVSQSGYSDYSMNLLITQGYNRQATGMLHIHTRCDSSTTIELQSLKWMYRYGFNANDVKVVTGDNTWSLYIMNSNSQYGRIQVQVISKSGTADDTSFTLNNNTSKESSEPSGTSATDGGVVNYANSANKVVNRGTHFETASGTTANSPTAGMLETTGLFMTQSYCDSAAPVGYGNIINLAGSGSGQLFCEWSGEDNTLGHLYYRSHRDTSTGGWSSWGKVAFVTDNVATANKLATARTISLTGAVTGSGTFDGSGDLSINTTVSHTHNYAGSTSAGGAANSLSGFKISTTTSLGGIDDTDVYQAIGYVYGLTNDTWNANQIDGALYRQSYSALWIHQIFGDYRTGQIAVRGRNNGTWQNWRTVLDSVNYTSYAPTKTGSGASGTWGINITGSAAKLENARNFSITGGATASNVSFNGTGNVALNVTSLNAMTLNVASGDTLILDGTI